MPQIRWMPIALAALALGACDDDDPVAPEPTPVAFEVRVENVSTVFPIIDGGVFATPSGAGMPGPLTPGHVYEATFGAGPSHRLHFATMFVQSNDFFYAPSPEGIALYVDGAPVTGDVTDQVSLWDAGTEADQEPGAGSDQAPRQAGPDTGADDPDSDVRLASDAFGNLPAVEDVLRAELDYLGGGRFRLRITNVSDATTLMTSEGPSPVFLAPGVYAASSEAGVLFEAGAPADGEGLERLAEDGNPGSLAEAMAARTGLTSPVAPGVWAVHRAPAALFAAGSPASAGLEREAEEGDAAVLATEAAASAAVASSGVFDTPDGASSAGPALPGGGFTFQVTAVPGDRLSFATMLGQSNDLFFGPSDAGIALFDGSTPVSRDVTGMVLLWDAGTEVNQQPGVGPDQAPRQPAADTGADEGSVVRQVNDEWTYPAVGDVVRVTIAPVGG